MAECFPSCSCEVQKELVDRYTDKVENVLIDPRGRQLFKKFMSDSKLKDGLKIINFWEKCDSVCKSNIPMSTDRKIYQKFLKEVDKLIDEADNIDHLDFALMEKLTNTRDGEDRDEIITVLKLLRNSVSDGLRTEYNLFRQYLLRKHSPH